MFYYLYKCFLADCVVCVNRYYKNVYGGVRRKVVLS